MGKLYEILGLAQYEAEKISSSPRDWLHYLDTASQLYRYSFSDTLLIYAQRPGGNCLCRAGNLESQNETVGKPGSKRDCFN